MFTNVRYFIKTSIIFLIVGLLSGLFLLLAKYYFGTGYSPQIISAHTHIILIGSVMMMIMGVALWFFPRAEKTDKRYNPDLISIVYWVLMLSTSTRFVMQFLSAFYSDEWIVLLITISSVLQVLSIALFFYSMWGRIRAVGSQYREAKGEKF